MAQVRRGKIISPARAGRRPGKTSRRAYPTGHYGATLRGVGMAPRKARLVAELIRGEPVERAREILRFSRKRAAYYFDRVLLSALSNADERSGGRADAEKMYVGQAYCDEGTRSHRFKCGPHGRARPIIRRTCHMTVVLAEMPEEKK